MGMDFSRHQFCWTFPNAFLTLTAHELAGIQKEL